MNIPSPVDFFTDHNRRNWSVGLRRRRVIHCSFGSTSTKFKDKRHCAKMHGAILFSRQLLTTEYNSGKPLGCRFSLRFTQRFNCNGVYREFLLRDNVLRKFLPRKIDEIENLFVRIVACLLLRRYSLSENSFVQNCIMEN